MTALKPIENRRILGVPATKYPVNNACSHPECAEPRNGRKGAHHIFPRSLITNDSYFVKIEGKETITIPHVTWLCPKHHDDVEQHRAWIKLEDELFVWYDRVSGSMEKGEEGQSLWADFNLVGPLDPQPLGNREKARKPKKRFTGEDRAERDRISISVPTGFARGGEVWDDLFGNGKNGQPYGRVRERFNLLMPAEGSQKPAGDRPPFELIVDMSNDWLNS